MRLNKLASLDYDNIEPWKIIEAFNKAQIEWSRRGLHGNNLYHEGDESSKRRIDDFEILLTYDLSVEASNKINYYEVTVPSDYMDWKRISALGSDDCCDKKKMIIYLAEQDNRDVLNRDHNYKPDFKWGETFATRASGKIQIHTNNEFELSDIKLTYYRLPRRIQIAGVKNPYDGTVSTVDVLSEFRDDVIEIIIEEAVKILAGDTESINQFQRASQTIEQNN